MTVTRRQSATGVYDQSSGSSTSLVATWPSATLSGSLLVAVVGQSLVATGSTTWSPPAGWTQVVSVPNATNVGVLVFERIASAVRSGAETFAITSASRDSTIHLMEYTSTNPLARSATGTGATGTGTTATTNAVAPATSASIVRIAGIASRQIDTHSSPTNGFSQIAQNQSPNVAVGGSFGNRVNTSSHQLIQPSSGAATACGVTISGSRPWAAVEVIWAETAATELRPLIWTGSAWSSATAAAKVWSGSAWV